jgi:hypothetical protein
MLNLIPDLYPKRFPPCPGEYVFLSGCPVRLRPCLCPFSLMPSLCIFVFRCACVNVCVCVIVTSVPILTHAKFVHICFRMCMCETMCQRLRLCARGLRGLARVHVCVCVAHGICSTPWSPDSMPWPLCDDTPKTVSGNALSCQWHSIPRSPYLKTLHSRKCTPW